MSAPVVLCDAFVAGVPVPLPRPRAAVLRAGHRGSGLRARVRLYVGGEVRRWQRTVALVARAARRVDRPAAGAVMLDLAFVLAEQGREPDLSNLVKAVEDALEGVLYTNDRQVTVLTARKRRGVAPGCYLRVVALPG